LLEAVYASATGEQLHRLWLFKRPSQATKEGEVKIASQPQFDCVGPSRARETPSCF